ncbi:MarR family winged helix-turn-helix transcriptional regulator [Staphylospora marina]|uniref:MarR family winged helix-turn-helix transcriptional regulator n=1 Tax=Staphylospora marina TaxID=2490858 RepID=UPI000F5BCD86|nr:hypothetical protein [Staphylospora marina]
MKGKQKPIGWWLKEADRAITRFSAKKLQELGLNRFQWQVLNVLREQGPVPARKIHEQVKLFVDEPSFAEMLRRFAGQGWIHLSDEQDPMDQMLSLTPEGEKAHAAAWEKQRQVRERLMEGISDEEYLTVIRVLQKITENLSRE